MSNIITKRLGFVWNSMKGNYSKRIDLLVARMKVMEEDIDKEIELLKQYYVEAGNLMSESQNYFLNGIQSGPIAKSYLLTRRGIEVIGEEVIAIPSFIDSVIRFANYPKRKIEVLVALAKHLEKINESRT